MLRVCSQCRLGYRYDKRGFGMDFMTQRQLSPTTIGTVVYGVGTESGAAIGVGRNTAKSAMDGELKVAFNPIHSYS